MGQWAYVVRAALDDDRYPPSFPGVPRTFAGGRSEQEASLGPPPGEPRDRRTRPRPHQGEAPGTPGSIHHARWGVTPRRADGGGSTPHRFTGGSEGGRAAESVERMGGCSSTPSGSHRGGSTPGRPSAGSTAGTYQRRRTSSAGGKNSHCPRQSRWTYGRGLCRGGGHRGFRKRSREPRWEAS